MEAVFGQLLAVMVLSVGAVDSSFLGPPCMSPLGLQLEVKEYSLTFDLAASSGDANDVKLNGPRSWRPVHVPGSFLEINISQPVLLTGLQVQGDSQQTGQISGWILDTSQDCDTYRSENYSLDPLSPVHTQTVHLKSVEFVSCIRLRPTQFKGKSAALRLELLGCVIEDSSVCDRDVHPVSEMWMESGGRQLNFLHEIVVSWVKILLDLQAYGDTGDAGIFYSRSCDQWHYYEPADTDVISVTSPDQTSSWMTIDLDKPVRAKCLRIFPPFSTTLKEVHTSGCSSHVTTNLHEITGNNKTKVYETDISAYQEDAPGVPHSRKTDTKQMPDSNEEKKKSAVWPDNSKTNAKVPQKQHEVDKTGATAKIVAGDSQDQVTRTAEEVPATLTTTIPEATEGIETPVHTGKVNKTMEDSLTKSTQENIETPVHIGKVNKTMEDSLTKSTQEDIEIPVHISKVNKTMEDSLTKSTQEDVETPVHIGKVNKTMEGSLTKSTQEDIETPVHIGKVNKTTEDSLTKSTQEDIETHVNIGKVNKTMEDSLTKSTQEDIETPVHIGKVNKSMEDCLTKSTQEDIETPVLLGKVNKSMEDSMTKSTQEDIETPVHIGKVHKTLEDILTKSTQKSTATDLTTTSYSPESTRGDRQNETQLDNVNNSSTSMVSLYDDMAAEQTNLVNTTMSNNISDVNVVEAGEHTTVQFSENSTLDANKDSNNRNTTMGYVVKSTDCTIGLPEKSADSSSGSPATVQPPARTSSVSSLDMGEAVGHQSENHNASVQSDNHSSVIHLENDSSVTQSGNNISIIHTENNSSSINHSENNISVILLENSNNSTSHSEINSSVIHPEDKSSVAVAEIHSPFIHAERNGSSIETGRNASDTNDWWRSHCGIKGGGKGYRKKRVISGQRNVPGEWPWLVSMHFLPPINFTEESGFKHLCGASLIAPNWIVTAAHCFSDALHDGLSNVSNWRVYFGMHDLAREEDENSVQERLIDTIYTYPKYDIMIDSLIYDIALVRLTEPVDYSDRVSPACLDDTDIHYEEIPCYVSGWGKLSNDSPGTRFPYTASLSTLSLANCKNKYDRLPDEHPMKNYIRIKPPVLCATVGTNGEDACQGDSGGPLMCQHDGRWYQAGVVAAGYLCGNEATPGLYSRISYYFDWIKQTIEDHGGL